MNKWNTIRTMLIFSILLIGIAFVTINVSFAYPKNESIKEWLISFGTIEYKGEEIENVSINHEQIDFSLTLTEENTSFVFTLPIENRGDYNATLRSIEMTDLTGEVIEEELLSDWINYTVVYAKNNELNDIYHDKALQVGDALRHHTINELLVTVSLKEEKVEELKEVYPDGLSVHLYLRTNYQEQEE